MYYKTIIERDNELLKQMIDIQNCKSTIENKYNKYDEYKHMIMEVPHLCLKENKTHKNKR